MAIRRSEIQFQGRSTRILYLIISYKGSLQNETICIHPLTHCNVCYVLMICGQKLVEKQWCIELLIKNKSFKVGFCVLRRLFFSIEFVILNLCLIIPLLSTHAAQCSHLFIVLICSTFAQRSKRSCLPGLPRVKVRAHFDQHMKNGGHCTVLFISASYWPRMLPSVHISEIEVLFSYQWLTMQECLQQLCEDTHTRILPQTVKAAADCTLKL